jgi:putative ABC transport system ATP-binding protein
VDRILSIRNLTKKRRAGAGFTLSIPRLDIARGERVALTGSSGSGKSTALDIMAMALQPDDAERFEFTPAADRLDLMNAWSRGRRDWMAAIRLRHIGYVLQTGGLLPFLTSRQNIVMARSALGMRTDGYVEGLVERLGLERLMDTMPARLSVGERQRVAIARAMAANPTLIMADEPTAALDPINAAEVMRLFSQVVQEQGTTLILATHDWDYAARSGLREIRVRLGQDPGDGTVQASLQG